MEPGPQDGQPPSGEEISAYVLGQLTADRAREIEAMAKVDEDLGTTILMMRALLLGHLEVSPDSRLGRQ